MKNVKSALLIAALVALARAQEHTISIEENVPALCCGTFDQAKPDYTDTGYIKSAVCNENGEEGYAWQIRSDEPVDANLLFRYSLDGNTPTAAVATINGLSAVQFDFEGTGVPSVWTDKAVNVTLVPGSNVLMVSGTGVLPLIDHVSITVVGTRIEGERCANDMGAIDYLMIANAKTGGDCDYEMKMLQEENPSLCTAGTVMTTTANFTGPGYTAYADASFTVSLIVTAPGTIELAIRYIHPTAMRWNVEVDGVTIPMTILPASPADQWSVALAEGLPVTTGSKLFVLSGEEANGGAATGGVDVDYVMLYPQTAEIRELDCGNSAFIIQEDEKGFCDAHGVVDVDHEGYTGTGFTNDEAGFCGVDGETVHGSVGTGAGLPPGVNRVTALSKSAAGLGHVDYLMFQVDSLVRADDCLNPSLVIQEEEEGYCGSDGVIEVEHNGHSGTGYTNTHNNAGHNITWNARLANVDYLMIASPVRVSRDNCAGPSIVVQEEETGYCSSDGSIEIELDGTGFVAGSHGITWTLVEDEGDGVGNIDYLMVTPLPIPNNGVLEVDSCTGPTLVIQEDADGFCFTDGVTEYEHGSHTAGGYINTHNGQGHNITWSVRAFANVNATVIVRYASGDTNNREGTFYVNGVEYPTISMPGTGDWHVWAYDIVPGFMLYPGTNKITLMSLTNTGLANVDYLMVLGNGELLEADYCKVPTLVLQEDATGYCDQHGTVDNNHDGHTGTGFSNTDNEFGNNITWSVRAYSRTTANAIIRYANGGTQERHGHMYVNGEQYPLITFPLTGAWTNWGLDRLGNITLQPGPNEIVLSANQNDGLANIDYLMLEGDDILEADSCTQPSLIVQELTEGYCKSDGVVSVEHDDHSGPGYVDTHNNKGHGITWNVRAYQVVTATVIVRFANGATDNRDASLMVNGVETGTMLMPSTGSWFTWQLDVAQNVQLIPGANLLQLVATTDAGLGNVDYIMVIGDGLLEADPCDSPTLVIQERVSGYCGSDGIIEEEHTDHGDGAYTNTHNYEGTNITWNVRTYVPSNVTIVVRYANGGDKDRHGMLSVNGEGVAVTTMPMTGDWKAWALDVIENVPLEAGANLLKLTAMIDHGLANVDYLMVKSSELVVVDECDMPSVILQEYETGYCHSDGIVEDEHDGHTGAGFTNTFNELNHNITWNVRAYSEIMTNFSVRFANGGNNDRHAIFYVNGDAHPNILMARTYAWTNWSMDFIYDVKLYPGANSIVLSSGQEEGLANVDYLMITGSGPVVADSCLSPTIVIQEGEDEPGYCSADGVIEWDHGEHSGEDGAVGGLKIAFLGHGEWIPLHHVPVDRFGYLFMAYLPRAWFFLAVECVLAVTLAIIDAIKAHTWTGCGNKKIVMLCAMVIYLGVVIWKMPHKQTFANALEILVTVLLCFSLLFMAIAYYSEDNVEHWCYSAANTIFTIATFVLLAKCILLMASALGVILTKRRSRLSDRVDASRNSYKLGDNYYNRELSTSLLNLDDGSSDADAGEELE
eukprot:gene411-588_t